MLASRYGVVTGCGTRREKRALALRDTGSWTTADCITVTTADPDADPALAVLVAGITVTVVGRGGSDSGGCVCRRSRNPRPEPQRLALPTPGTWFGHGSRNPPSTVSYHCTNSWPSGSWATWTPTTGPMRITFRFGGLRYYLTII